MSPDALCESGGAIRDNNVSESKRDEFTAECSNWSAVITHASVLSALDEL